MKITFTVLGLAQPAGSKSSFVPKNKATGQPFQNNGRVIVNTVDANKKAKPWQAEVKHAARQAYSGQLLDGPLRVRFVFYRPRPKGHYGKKGLNKSGLASTSPTTKPDVLKLARAVEDAMTSVIYRDDAQIVEEYLGKAWGEPARVEIEIDTGEFT